MRRAFTVLELLIVVAVLAILMGITIPVLSGIRERARKKVAKQKLGAICLALESYYMDFGAYPPDTGPDDADSDGKNAYSLYQHLCGPGGMGHRAGERLYGPYLQPREDELKDDGGDNKILVDFWGEPYVYEENLSHLTKKTIDPKVTQKLLDGTFAHNPRGYDIYSKGMDGEKDPLHNLKDDDGDGKVDEDDELVDDVGNW